MAYFKSSASRSSISDLVKDLVLPLSDPLVLKLRLAKLGPICPVGEEAPDLPETEGGEEGVKSRARRGLFHALPTLPAMDNER